MRSMMNYTYNRSEYSCPELLDGGFANNYPSMGRYGRNMARSESGLCKVQIEGVDMVVVRVIFHAYMYVCLVSSIRYIRSLSR